MNRTEELKKEIEKAKKKAYSGVEEDLQHATYRHIVYVNELELKGRQDREKEIIKLIEQYNKKAKKCIQKNIKAKKDSLCYFGTLGEMSVENLVDTFLGEELKESINPTDNISLCKSCNTMSHTVDGKCGKCEERK